jgi:hypothetical protein
VVILAEANLAAVAAARLAIAAIQLILGRALQGRALLAQESRGDERAIVTTPLWTGLNKDRKSSASTAQDDRPSPKTPMRRIGKEGSLSASGIEKP